MRLKKIHWKQDNYLLIKTVPDRYGNGISPMLHLITNSQISFSTALNFSMDLATNTTLTPRLASYKQYRGPIIKQELNTF